MLTFLTRLTSYPWGLLSRFGSPGGALMKKNWFTSSQKYNPLNAAFLAVELGSKLNK